MDNCIHICLFNIYVVNCIQCFSLYFLKQAEELEENTEQVTADKKLVDRLVKLLFLPAKMSINTPENHQDLFDDLDGN